MRKRGAREVRRMIKLFNCFGLMVSNFVRFFRRNGAPVQMGYFFLFSF